MATIGIRELANHTSAVVDEVNRTGRPTLVTKNGRPVAVLAAIDEEELLDHVLANSPEYVRSMRTAEREITRERVADPLKRCWPTSKLERNPGSFGHRFAARRTGSPRCSDEGSGRCRWRTTRTGT